MKLYLFTYLYTLDFFFFLHLLLVHSKTRKKSQRPFGSVSKVRGGDANLSNLNLF